MSRKILIIEDDTDILSVLEQALILHDFAVHGLERTDDILKIIKDHQPALVLTDYMLPGMNGGQICNLIKNTGETRLIPVILMSAYHEMAISLAKFNYDAYLPKPFDVKKLISTINRLIG